MIVTMKGNALPSHRDVDAILEVFRTASWVVQEYENLMGNDVDRDKYGKVGMYGMLQCITQLVEATEHICDMLSAPNCLDKKKEYWKSRNRHTHVKTRAGVRSGGGDDFDVHQFRLENTSAENLSYISIDEDGFAGRSIDMQGVIHQLQWDLGSVMDSIIAQARTHIKSSP
jgi:hypothetical protein